MRKLLFSIVAVFLFCALSSCRLPISSLDLNIPFEMTEADRDAQSGSDSGTEKDFCADSWRDSESEDDIRVENETVNDADREEEDSSESSDIIPEPVRRPISIDTIERIVGDRAESFTVGEDRYDIDCKAYRVSDATIADYRWVISELKNEYMRLYTDNGEKGIDGACYQSTFYDEAYTVNVTLYERVGELYLTVEKYRPLSEFQIAPETAVKGTRTTFHMPEMPTVDGSYKFGECEIFRLSNGHFVIVDGAQEFSAEPTVEYLESLTPNGAIPVVDAWFLTHAHPDHAYCVWGIGRDSDLVKRIRVEGFYYTLPDDEGMRRESDYDDLMLQVSNIREALGNFRNSNGLVTAQYKLHGGMRFYFGELEVQVLFTQDQIRPEEYGNKFNDTSTSFKFIVHTEGKDDTTFLIMGDASEAICKKLMKMYQAETLHTTYFQSLHHGNNDCPEFFRYIKPDYLNYTYKSDKKGKDKAGYKYLELTCKGVNCSPCVIEIK